MAHRNGESDMRAVKPLGKTRCSVALATSFESDDLSWSKASLISHQKYRYQTRLTKSYEKMLRRPSLV